MMARRAEEAAGVGFSAAPTPITGVEGPACLAATSALWVKEAMGGTKAFMSGAARTKKATVPRKERQNWTDRRRPSRTRSRDATNAVSLSSEKERVPSLASHSNP
jgi:hypothetical protein